MMRATLQWLLVLALLAGAAAPAVAHMPGNGHDTSSTVVCTPNPVTRGNSTTCTVTVQDETGPAQAASPVGSVSFTSSTAGAIDSCALAPGPTFSSACSITYTPAAAGSETITASYAMQQDTVHRWAATTANVALTVNPAPPATLRVVQSPSGQPTHTVAGTPIQRAGGGGIQVEVLNTLGERIESGTGSTLAVTIAIQTNAGGGTLSGTLTVNAVSGVATFSDLSINRAGIGYTLRATGPGVTGVTTTGFNITAAAASRFAFAQQPSNTVAGQAIGGGTGVTVRVEDQFGNVVPTDNTTSVTVGIGANPGGGTLAGTVSRTAVNGVASFNDLSIDKAGEEYTLQATGALASATSGTFNILVGSASQLAFGAQPVDTVAGQLIGGGNVTVRVEDNHGNLITTSSAAITVSLAANPGMAALQGTLTVNATGGIATFSNLVITHAASGYALGAAATGLLPATSAAFDILSSPADRLAFGQPPTNNEAGTPITPAITVRIEDANGNLVNDNRDVTLELGANPGGTTLQGTLTRAAANGIATFDDIEIDVAANGYTLIATTTGGLGPVTSAAFNIAAGTPTRLEFVQHPTTTAAGAMIAPAVTVRILDTPGNVVTGATNAVTVAIATNPAGGTLSGTQTVNAVNGVATFSTLSINRAGVGYTLAASATSLASATSGAFDITVAAPFAVKFVQQPANTIAGEVISGAVGGVSVRIEDASGNLVTGSSASVTMAIEFDAGGAGTPLNGTVTVNAVNGIATFPNLSLNRAGNGYTLRATSGSLQAAISSSFNITHGAAAKLAFGVHPANTTAGNTITPAVTVRVRDQFDNLVTNSTASVALSIANNPGGGTLGGNSVANAVNGVATFNNLVINAAGTGYTLAANSGGLAGATSNAFNINAGSAARLAFTVQPTNTQLLETITPAVRVAVQDNLGNTITGSTATVSLVLDSNPGGGELGGTISVAAVNGIATFPDLSLDRTGNGYTLQANSSGLASAISGVFNILVGPPARLAFVQQPVNTAPNTDMTPWPSVRAEDAAGNPVPYTGNITLAIGNNPAAGTLSGTLTVAAVDGVATFNNLRIDNNGNGYTLSATSGTLQPAESNPFNVMDPGFTFTGITPASGPSTGGTFVTLTGSGFGPQIGRYQVIFGMANPAPPVTADRESSGELTAHTPAHPPGLVNVIVVDTATGGTRALQNIFTYVSQPPTKLAFGNQPTNIVAGGPFSPPVTVRIVDENNNVVNNASHAITISFFENIPGGELLGTKTVSAVAGVATFSDLSVDKVGAGYRLTASSPGLTDPAPSNAFSVSAGAAAKLAFQQQPTNNDPGVPITPAITVQVRDEHDNLVQTSSATVEMAIGINAGAGTLSGGTSVAAVNGVATFNSLAIDKAGDGYTLVATSTGLAQAESSNFDIRFGAPARVTVTTHPGNGIAGEPLTPAIVAQVEDSLGNVVTDYTDPVTIQIDTNPGGATLSGTLTAVPVDGVATFNNVRLDKVGAGYKLAATAFGLEAGITNPFNVANNVPAGLQFVTQPGDTSQGAVITPQPQVRVVDQFGNHVPDATNAITVAIGTNPGGGTLGGTLTRNATSGVATFNNLTINAGGNGYTLVASSGTLATATSMPFRIISVGGSFNVFSPDTPAGAIVGYLPTIVAGEDFCVDFVKINDAGTAPASFTNITVTLQMLDSSVNTGSLQPGNCRSSWTVIDEWKGIAAAPGDGSRKTICAGLQGPTGSQTLNNLNSSNVWPNVRFRVFTTSGHAGVGCSSDAFAIRPDFFSLTSILVSDEDWQTAGTARSLILPGAPTTSGGPVHAAGRPFRVQVTAVNAQGQPASNYAGQPRIEVIERLLPATCAGCPAPQVLSSGWGPSASVPGAVRTNQAVFHDAGALRIRIVDETFSEVDQVDVDLGLQDPDAGVIVSPPIDIGRFVPDNFLVSPTSTPEFYTHGNGTCAGDRSFTYIGQDFRYKTLPQATVVARSASGATTPAYRGDLWKVTAAKVLQEYTDNTVPAEAAELDTSDAPLADGTLVPNNDGTGTLTVGAVDSLRYEREPLVPAGDPLLLPEPPLPFDAFISLTLRVFDDTETGVGGNAQINTGTPGVFNNIDFDFGNEFRYGRLRLVNSVGSELEPLEMPYRLQTWQDLGNDIHAWVTEPGDNCSAFDASDFTIGAVENTGIGGLAPVIADIDSPTAAGVGDITFCTQDGCPHPPAVTGSFEVTGTSIPLYLQYNWNDDAGGAETGPTAKGAFGVNEGNPRRIFRSQSFIPRTN